MMVQTKSMARVGLRFIISIRLFYMGVQLLDPKNDMMKLFLKNITDFKLYCACYKLYMYYIIIYYCIVSNINWIRLLATYTPERVVCILLSFN